MDTSQYFAKSFRFFFLRFRNEEALFNWFLDKADDFTAPFNYPEDINGNPRTIVFLPYDQKEACEFINALPQQIFKNTLFHAPEELKDFLTGKNAQAVYFREPECRYGDPAFKQTLKQLFEFVPKTCIFLGNLDLPRLYLAKKCGAAFRIGFNCESIYPFLNISMKTEKMSKVQAVVKFFGKG